MVNSFVFSSSSFGLCVAVKESGSVSVATDLTSSDGATETGSVACEPLDCTSAVMVKSERVAGGGGTTRDEGFCGYIKQKFK